MPMPDPKGLEFVTRHFRDSATPGWEIVAEADRTVVVRRVS